jgi:hypothetical protein
VWPAAASAHGDTAGPHAFFAGSPGNVDDLPCPVELGDGGLGQPDPADPALGPQVAQRAELVGERCSGVDAVQPEQFDPLDAQPAQGLLDPAARHGRPAASLHSPPGPVRATPALVVTSSPSG